MKYAILKVTKDDPQNVKDYTKSVRQQNINQLHTVYTSSFPIGCF